MSTRATVHFEQGGMTEAIVYRHSDGYPEGLGEDLKRFFQEVKAHTSDTRFGDPVYLAAKWVVYDSQDQERWSLNFLGVGIVMRDPGDIEYRYHVECNGGQIPTVRVEQV